MGKKYRRVDFFCKREQALCEFWFGQSGVKMFLSKRAFNRGRYYISRRVSKNALSLVDIFFNWRKIGRSERAIQPSISGGVKEREGENRNGSPERNNTPSSRNPLGRFRRGLTATERPSSSPSSFERARPGKSASPIMPSRAFTSKIGDRIVVNEQFPFRLSNVFPSLEREKSDCGIRD